MELVTKEKKEKEGPSFKDPKKHVFLKKKWLKENKYIQLSFTVTRWKKNKFVYFALKDRNGINEREREFTETDFGSIEGKILK